MPSLFQRKFWRHFRVYLQWCLHIAVGHGKSVPPERSSRRPIQPPRRPIRPSRRPLRRDRFSVAYGDMDTPHSHASVIKVHVAHPYIQLSIVPRERVNLTPRWSNLPAGLFGVRSGSVRGPFEARSGSVPGPFGICSSDPAATPKKTQPGGWG